jgi:soluble lytic murein transglycosylase-like protein
MTTPAVHCYRHASRFARRVLRRRRPLRMAAAAGWGGVALMALVPTPVGGEGGSALAVVRAGGVAAVIASPPAADLVPVVASALADCANALPHKERWRIARIIDAESAAHGYDPLFVTALMQVESECLPTARGGRALGLVQVLPSTAREVARRLGIPWRGERTLTEPSSNIQIGLRYLRELEGQLGDPYRAVAAYNMGPARVLRMSSGRARQTRYVRKVLARYERLLEQYA